MRRCRPPREKARVALTDAADAAGADSFPGRAAAAPAAVPLVSVKESWAILSPFPTHAYAVPLQ
jgi:hypothetical protein